MQKVTDNSLLSTHSEILSTLRESDIYGEPLRAMQEHIKGKLLIDIGGGDAEYIRDFAADAEVSGYINIDQHHPQGSRAEGTHHFIEHKGDPLDLLTKKLLASGGLYTPGDPVSFTINGADDTSWNDYKNFQTLLGRMYLLMQQGDYLLTIGSPAILQHIDTATWEITTPKSDTGIMIARKR